LTNVWCNADESCVIYNATADTTNDRGQPKTKHIQKKEKKNRKKRLGKVKGVLVSQHSAGV